MPVNIKVTSLLNVTRGEGRLAKRNPFFQREGKRILKEIGNEFVDALINERLDGNPIERRTGKFSDRKNFRVRVKSQPGAESVDLELSITIGGPQAQILEQGGTITPKSGKFLAIPLDAARDADGAVLPGFETPRNFKTRLVPSPNGGYLVFIDGMRAPVFKLQSSVTIPPQLGARAFFRSGEMRKLLRRKKAEFARLLNKELS